jgi:hypothetical protein
MNETEVAIMVEKLVRDHYGRYQREMTDDQRERLDRAIRTAVRILVWTVMAAPDILVQLEVKNLLARYNEFIES